VPILAKGFPGKRLEANLAGMIPMIFIIFAIVRISIYDYWFA
jgi:hypothetical protein